jgi:ribosomal protein S18 acetylase RimI-like enzyme
MEFANSGTHQTEMLEGVRIAGRNDLRAISTLLQNADRKHIHVDWHYPVDWLGSPGFVVMNEPQRVAGSGSLANRFFGSDPRVSACLAVAADPPPAAWVRVAAISEAVNGRAELAKMFAAIGEHLQQTAVSQIGWLPVEPWPQPWMRELGFEMSSTVETFVKDGTDVPPIKKLQGLKFRSVLASDLEELERMEKKAYQPLWRSSVVSLSLARRQTFSFDVAEYDGRVVGYQCSTLMNKGAHLSRITIDPALQGKGIGSALLAHAFERYRQKGVETVSLNTQLDNVSSRHLYEKFEFRPSGQRFPVWVKKVTHGRNVQP